MNAIRNSIAKREYAREAKVLERSVLRRLSPVSRRLLVEAESQARALDDNHVGTEHIMLAIYALGARAATKASNRSALSASLSGGRLPASVDRIIYATQ